MELQLTGTFTTGYGLPSHMHSFKHKTRRLLLDKDVLGRIWILRNHLADMNPLEANGIPQGKNEIYRY